MQRSKEELSKKVMFTLFILLICRVGSFIPVPGIKKEGIRKTEKSREDNKKFK